MGARSSAGGIAHWLAGRTTSSAAVPSPSDVDGFRRAQEVAFSCAKAAAREMRPGWTESRTGRWMLEWFGDHGIRAHLHKPIVAFGERTLAPTRQWGPARGEGRSLQDGDVVILDCAPVVDGYTGDIAYTASASPNAELLRAQEFLSGLRARIPERFADPATADGVFDWIDQEIRTGGYGNAADGYVDQVIGHRVYRHGRILRSVGWFLPEKPFGWIPSWHGVGFLLNVSRHGIYPEELGPLHRGPKTGMWAVEPHVRVEGFGAKFEEVLVVEREHAYWLDDLSQERIVIGA